MNVCLVTPHFPPMPWPCGIADYVQKLGTELAKLGHQVTVVTANGAAQDVEGVSVVAESRRWSVLTLRRLGAWISTRGFDVVDVQYEGAMYRYSPCVLAWPFFLRRPVGRVLTLHSRDLPRPGGRLWRPVQILPYDAVVFYSPIFRDQMAARFPWRASRFNVQGLPSNIVRSANPHVGPLVAKFKLGWTADHDILLYFGHVTPGRGIEDILDALVAMRERRRPQFVVASHFAPDEHDYHRALLHRVVASGLSDQVHFTGRLTEQEVSQLLDAADVCVLPFPDGASMNNTSLAAAIDHGTPIITTVTASTEADLLASGAIRTYPPGDRTKLVEALTEVLESPEIRSGLRTGALRLRDARSWKRYIDDRSAVYKRLKRTAVSA